jgi:F1F0 ATPase subunit 2
MSDLLRLILALAAGGALGAVFFGGLWWTVARGVSSNAPGLWFLISLVLRTGFAVAGFWFASAGHWDRMLSCLLGFVAARLAVTRLIRREGRSSSTERLPRKLKEASHAP